MRAGNLYCRQRRKAEGYNGEIIAARRTCPLLGRPLRRRLSFAFFLLFTSGVVHRCSVRASRLPLSTNPSAHPAQPAPAPAQRPAPFEMSSPSRAFSTQREKMPPVSFLRVRAAPARMPASRYTNRLSRYRRHAERWMVAQPRATGASAEDAIPRAGVRVQWRQGFDRSLPTEVIHSPMRG